MSDLENISFDYNFAKPFDKDTDLNVLHISKSHLDDSQELSKVLFC